MKRVHIIGAGLAGLSASVKLAEAGWQVTLYEAAGQAGGRCRSYADPQLGRRIDNGNHLLLGTNRAALAFARTIGALDRLRHYPRPHYLLVDATTGKRLRLTRGMALKTLARLALAGSMETVGQRFHPQSTLYAEFVAPFCVSALNTPPESASAVMMRRVLWRILRAGAAGMDAWLPVQGWSESLIDPAVEFIRARGGELRLYHGVRELGFTDDRVTDLVFADETVAVDGADVVLAVSPSMAAKLLPGVPVMVHHAIVNGHFAVPDGMWPFADPLIGITGGTAEWLFYRDGMISTTTSAADTLARLPQAEIAPLLWRDIMAVTGIATPLPAHRVIIEKQAAFASVPGRPVVNWQANHNLTLAGDYTWPDLPATMESAILSGIRAAARIIRPPDAARRNG